MEIVVDHDKCTGWECISVCPAEVYELNDDGKSEPACVEVCPEGAITIDVCE